MEMKLFGQVQSARKHFVDGTHRTCAPETTIERYRHLMPVLGITRLANVTGLDRIGLPVCVAVRPNSRALATSQGKGETIAAAKASALMESIETWHAERVEGHIVIGSYQDLSMRYRVADVHRMSLREGAVLATDKPTEWIKGEDLYTNDAVLVPFESVSTNFVEPGGYRPVYMKSSNGLSSGNHVLEAVTHGLSEVIERDALSKWKRLGAAEQKARQVDLATVTAPSLLRVMRQLSNCGIALTVWDITTEIGVPVYTCAIVEDPQSPQWRPIPIFSGHGCHLSPTVALSRAVHEAIQSRATVIAGSRDDMFPEHYGRNNTLAEHQRFLAGAAAPAATLAMRQEQPDVPGASFEDDAALLLQRLRANGINEVIAVDLSRPDIGIPVVKMIVPGLEFDTSARQPTPQVRQTEVAA